MPGHVKLAGAWELLKRPHGKTGGTWKQIAKAYTKRAGAWERWYSSAPPVLPVPTAITTFRVHAATGTELVTFGWTENAALEGVIDYEFVCIPYFGGYWTGDDPFMSNTPSAFAADGGVLQRTIIPAVTPGAVITKTYQMTTNGKYKTFRVRARNSYGYGPWSDVIYFASNSDMYLDWTYIPAPDVQVFSQQILNPGLTTQTYQVQFSGLSGLSAPPNGVEARGGFRVPGGETGSPTYAAATVGSPFPDPLVFTVSSSNTNRSRGAAICPAITITNKNYTTCAYSIIFTTAGFISPPLNATDIEEYYTLVVGTDNYEGGAFPDRGYVKAGEHTNSVQIGSITPNKYAGTTYDWGSLVRSGYSTGVAEVEQANTTFQKLVCVGYGTPDQGELCRMRPSSLATFKANTESQWGNAEFTWTTDSGAWQFLQGQTYTIKVIRAP